MGVAFFCLVDLSHMPAHAELDGYAGPENAETNEYLRTRHGECFIGFPLYRLVHSSFLWQFSAGEWSDWDPGLPIESRGTLVTDETGKGVAPNTRAERVVTEMRRRHKYAEFVPFPGWVLERWMPPSYFGTPGWWNGQLVEGTSLQKLGPYPYQGAYISVMGEGFRPYPEAPTGPFLDRLIEMWNIMQQEVLSMTPETYILKREHEMREEQDETDERWRRESSAANQTVMQPFFSTYMEAGRARALAAEHAGLTSHYGN
jgi:hypothetical protein